MASVLVLYYKSYYLVSPGIDLGQVKVIYEGEHGLSRWWAIHTEDKREEGGL